MMGIIVLSIVAGMVVVGGLWMATRPSQQTFKSLSDSIAKERPEVRDRILENGDRLADQRNNSVERS